MGWKTTSKLNYFTEDQNFFVLVFKKEPREEYNLRNVQAPVALFSGELDEVATPEDTAYLTKVLPNIITDEVIHNYGHFDLILAQNLRTILIDRILELFNEFMDQSATTRGSQQLLQQQKMQQSRQFQQQKQSKNI